MRPCAKSWAFVSFHPSCFPLALYTQIEDISLFQSYSRSEYSEYLLIGGLVKEEAEGLKASSHPMDCPLPLGDPLDYML